MSGHSKWHNIKGKKTAEDAKRGKLFTKLGKEISIASREGGGDPAINPRLRTAMEKAKAGGMPNVNIDRAIKRGTGDLKDGAVFLELVYEGYGPEGTAILIEVATDNKNRTSAEVRKIFSKFGGSMGEQGCVSWMFKTVGVISLANKDLTEDEVFEISSICDAEDFEKDGDTWVITVGPKSLYSAKEALEKANIEIETSDIDKIPNTMVKIVGDRVSTMLKLVTELEDNDDVTKMYSNYDISDEDIEAYFNN
jgi:YebC/PmpR family DNA-binding regulatory protein